MSSIFGLCVWASVPLTVYNVLIGILLGILSFVPISEIIIKLTQTVLSKCVKPKQIPKMDFSLGVPKEYTTMIVIPSIVKTGEDIKKVFEKLEVYYLANKSENIYLTALRRSSSRTKRKRRKRQ